jgi:hypothetical protein
MSDILGEFLPVHVNNIKELADAVQKVEEISPDHVNLTTFVMVASAGSSIAITELLQEDLMRKDALIISSDAPVILCHSNADANNASNMVAGTPNPVGFYLAQGIGVALSGTSKVWAVGPTGSRISVAVTRRGH